MKHELGIHSRLSRLVLPVLAIGILIGSVATASAANPLEGVWSFNGGKIAIHSEGAEGALVGTVVAPTTFAACPHQVEEDIWTDITSQADGSYWGDHQWFYENGSCTPNQEPGPTAFRVLANGSGRYLRVCLSEPGQGQPTIAADGRSAGASFGCVDSELIATLPTGADLNARNLIGLRADKACLAARILRVHIREPASDSIVKSQVTASGGGVKRHLKVVKRGKGGTAIIHPREFPGSHLIVSVTLKTALGHTIKTKRRYRYCGTRKPHRRHD